MYRRPIIISSATATVLTLVYYKASSFFILDRVQNKFPGELFQVSNVLFENDAALYLWELQKQQFYYFILSSVIISLGATILLWKKGNEFKATGLLFFAFSIFTMLNGYNYIGFWTVNLLLLVIPIVVFLINRRSERSRFVAVLFILCSILVNAYCHLIGFGGEIK